MGHINRGALVLQLHGDGSRTAAIYLGEDLDGTGVVAPLQGVETVEHSDLETNADTFAVAIPGWTPPVASLAAFAPDAQATIAALQARLAQLEAGQAVPTSAPATGTELTPEQQTIADLEAKLAAAQAASAADIVATTTETAHPLGGEATVN